MQTFPQKNIIFHIAVKYIKYYLVVRRGIFVVISSYCAVLQDLFIFARTFRKRITVLFKRLAVENYFPPVFGAMSQIPVI